MAAYMYNKLYTMHTYMYMYTVHCSIHKYSKYVGVIGRGPRERSGRGERTSMEKWEGSEDLRTSGKKWDGEKMRMGKEERPRRRPKARRERRKTRHT